MIKFLLFSLSFIGLAGAESLYTHNDLNFAYAA